MRLDVYAEYLGKELLTGILDTEDNEGFTYSRAWIEDGPGRPLSLSLPLQEERFTHRQVRPYFDGLLPEGGPRSKVASRLHVSSRSYVKILAGIGWECIGAVSVHGETPRPTEGYLPLTDENLAQIAVELSVKGTVEYRDARFSLAGAQPKTALYRADDGTWLRPLGGAPSTHIAKPASVRFSDAAVNEAVCSAAAFSCGILAPEVSVIPGEPALLVTKRFDRTFVENSPTIDGQPVPTRLHQEDFCQALGVVPERKYEERSGRGYLEQCADLIRRSSTSAIADLERLWEYTVFSYIIGNCDMHLKNVSLLRSADWRELTLAPTYDIVATAQYDGLSNDMAMGIGGVRAIGRIDADAFAREARTLMLPQNWAMKRAGHIAAKAPEAIAQAASSLEKAGAEGAVSFAETILPGVEARAGRLTAG